MPSLAPPGTKPHCISNSQILWWGSTGSTPALAVAVRRDWQALAAAHAILANLSVEAAHNQKHFELDAVVGSQQQPLVGLRQACPPTACNSAAVAMHHHYSEYHRTTISQPVLANMLHQTVYDDERLGELFRTTVE